MQEIYEVNWLKKELNKRREKHRLGKYEQEAIASLLTENLISEEESDFLYGHLSF